MQDHGVNQFIGALLAMALAAQVGLPELSVPAETRSWINFGLTVALAALVYLNNTFKEE